jgi:hypothetical protein
VTLYDYNKLNLTERANKLWGDGVFIVSVNNYALYVLYEFLVEVVLHNSEIVELRAFKRGALLEKYLEVMELPK